MNLITSKIHKPVARIFTVLFLLQTISIVFFGSSFISDHECCKKTIERVSDSCCSDNTTEKANTQNSCFGFDVLSDFSSNTCGCFHENDFSDFQIVSSPINHKIYSIYSILNFSVSHEFAIPSQHIIICENTTTSSISEIYIKNLSLII